MTRNPREIRIEWECEKDISRLKTLAYVSFQIMALL